MKVIELSHRIIFVNDIVSIYNEYKCGEFINHTNYYIETKHGRIPVEEYDYKKVKEYLLSLNEEEEGTSEDTPKEDKKIERFYFSVYQDQKLGGREVVEPLETKINEIIDKINGE